MVLRIIERERVIIERESETSHANTCFSKLSKTPRALIRFMVRLCCDHQNIFSGFLGRMSGAKDYWTRESKTSHATLAFQSSHKLHEL